LVPQLAGLTQQHPEICLELSAARHEVDLLRGDVELALRIGAVEVPPGLIVRKLGSVGYGLYGTLGTGTFVGFDDTMRGTAQKQWLESRAAGERVTFRSNDLFAHYQAARAGLGIALLPHFMLEPGDGLEPFMQGSAPFERDLSLIVHPDVRRSARVTAVSRYLRDLIHASAARLTLPRASVEPGNGPRRRGSKARR
jgi:DNA-binding transcriptional LysR family regulator